jgi:hypothetical protein
MNPKLAKYEKDERYLASKLFNQFKGIKSYTFTKGRICYDTTIILQNDDSILGEMKVRSFKIDKYDDYILEVVKLVSLIKKAKAGGHMIYYINFFESDKRGMKDFIVFNISARLKEWKDKRPEVKKMWMNEVTFLSTDKKVMKDVIMLKYDPGKDMKGTFSLN